MLERSLCSAYQATSMLTLRLKDADDVNRTLQSSFTERLRLYLEDSLLALSYRRVLKREAFSIQTSVMTSQRLRICGNQRYRLSLAHLALCLATDKRS
eukprot:5554133-Prymnesium_polylepis.1